MDEGLWSMVSAAGAMEKGILALLLVMSIVLWTIVFLKLPEFIAARRSSNLFMKRFRNATSFSVLNDLPSTASVEYQALYAAYEVMREEDKSLSEFQGEDLEALRGQPLNASEELILLSMQHRATSYFAHMQSGLSYMATIGSTTPFIGLFGTVVGIMTTFKDLGQTKTPSMQVVAPGISGALVATAAGLAVAIPAVIACNWFLAEIDELREQMDCAIDRAMALLRPDSQAVQYEEDAEDAIEEPEDHPQNVVSASKPHVPNIVPANR